MNLRSENQTRMYAALGGQGEWWATFCDDCGEKLSAFDPSREDSQRLAGTIDHRCFAPPRVDPNQGELFA